MVDVDSDTIEPRARRRLDGERVADNAGGVQLPTANATQQCRLGAAETVGALPSQAPGTPRRSALRPGARALAGLQPCCWR